MSTLDLAALDIALRDLPRALLVDEYMATLRGRPGPHDRRRLRAVPRERLAIPLRGPGDEPPREPPFPGARRAEDDPCWVEAVFDELLMEAFDLGTLLARLNAHLIGPGTGWRSDAPDPGQCRRAPPPASRIAPSLALIAELRDAAPLCHPLWNTLLLWVLLRDLRPFVRGNARTLDAFVSYELWWAGCYGCAVLPFGEVLAVNGAALERLDARRDRAGPEGRDRVPALAAQLGFLLRAMIVTIEHGEPVRPLPGLPGGPPLHPGA